MSQVEGVGNSAPIYRPDWKRAIYKFSQPSEFVPVIPLAAKLEDGSSVSPSMLGKVVGVRKANGKWIGLGGKWSAEYQMTKERAKQADTAGAYIGIQGRMFPGCDIDIDNPSDVASIKELAFATLGPTIARGRANSARIVLMFETADGEVIRKRRIVWEGVGAVEILGVGQYYNVDGLHPSGVPYVWDTHPCDVKREDIPKITAAQVDAFRNEVLAYGDMMGYRVVADSGSRSNPATRKKIGDAALVAPDFRDVLAILKTCANTDESYDGFITLLAAIKAALGDDAEDFFPQVLEWALDYPDNTEDMVRAKWLSIRDAAVGWGYLEAWSRSCGFNASVQRDFDDAAPDTDPENPDGSIPENPVDQMIKRHVYVKEQDKFYDVEDGVWLNGKGFNAANTQVARYGRTGIQSAEAEFQNNPKARRVVTTTYKPGEAVITQEKNKHGALVSALNPWRPSSIVPAKNVSDADVEPWLTLVDPLFGRATPEREHFLDWWAYVLQKPGQKIGHAIVITGGQGVGKDTALRPLFDAVGQQNVAPIDTTILTNQFNYFLRYQVVYVQEIKMHGKYDLYNSVKPYISAQTTRLALNEKNMKQQFVPNTQVWVITSNHDNALTLEDDDRRFWVHHTVIEEPPTDEFFANLHGWYEAGGIEKVAGWLLQRDLSGFNPMARPPVTAAKKAMLELSQPAPVRWLCEQLAGSLAHRQVVTVRELKALQREDWIAASQDRLTDKQAMAALKVAGFISAHRVRLPKEGMERLWARGVAGSVTADAMRKLYEFETKGGPQCKAA